MRSHRKSSLLVTVLLVMTCFIAVSVSAQEGVLNEAILLEDAEGSLEAAAPEGTVLFLSRASSQEQQKQHKTVAQGFGYSTLAPLKTLILPPVPDEHALAQVRAAIPEDTRSVVTWGRNALSLVQGAAREIPSGVPVLAAGLARPLPKSSLPNQQLTAQPDPSVVIGKAAQLMPSLKSLHVVINPEHSGWLIDHMTQALASHNMTLKVHAANGIRAVAAAYQGVLLALDPAKDALWIPPVRAGGEQVILPLVLKSAWNRRLMTIGSRLEHVEQGVLLGVTTTFLAQGRELASIEQQLSQDSRNPQAKRSEAPGGVQFATRATRLAVNKRAAARLGITLLPHHVEDVTYVMPM